MAETVYQYVGGTVEKNTRNTRWISREEIDLFNAHLSLCAQSLIGQSVWDRIYDEGTIYCILFEYSISAARACVEKYSNEAWKAADIRVIKAYRNKGFAYGVSLFVLKYIIDNGRNATIRTEEDNYPMQRVISKLGFMPLL